jgi:hypothetical protein
MKITSILIKITSIVIKITSIFRKITSIFRKINKSLEPFAIFDSKFGKITIKFVT